MYSEVRDYA